MNGKKGEPSIMENVVLIILPILLELVVALASSNSSTRYTLHMLDVTVSIKF